jgi:hypothetical protein
MAAVNACFNKPPCSAAPLPLLTLPAVPRKQIPTKIEVFVGYAGPAAAPDADPAAMAAAVSNLRRLGYLSFDSNERSNHQARELKSVHVSVEAQLVRLLIHRCHVNKLNIYNQVRTSFSWLYKLGIQL